MLFIALRERLGRQRRVPSPFTHYDLSERRGFGSLLSAALDGDCMTLLLLLTGLVVGAFSGVVGIGGGILFVPALIWLLGMDQHKAQGTSLGALLAPVGIFAFLEYYRRGNADLRVALLLALGFIVGGYFGAVGAQHISDLWLRRIFALTLILVGGRMWFTKS
jgi:uncharacterized membrane protein YfcA